MHKKTSSGGGGGGGGGSSSRSNTADVGRGGAQLTSCGMPPDPGLFRPCLRKPSMVSLIATASTPHPRSRRARLTSRTALMSIASPCLLLLSLWGAVAGGFR